MTKVRRFIAVLLLGVSASLAAAACGSGGSSDKSAVTIQLSEFAFQPADVTVPKDAKVTLRNDGSVAHSYILKEAGRGTAGVAPGTSVVLDLEGVPPGTYTVYCDQPGHAQAGQTGRLIITD